MATLSLALGALSVQADGLGKSFKEDFNTLDESHWYISDGWRNGEYQNCLWNRDRVKIANGKLHLQYAPASNGKLDYECAEISTRQRYGYGLYEARIQTDTGSGLNAAFFTYIGPSQGARWDEIDVEILTKDTGMVEFNTYVNGQPKNGTKVPISPSTDQAYHVYSILWTPHKIRWYINGTLVHQTRGNNLPVEPQKIFASHWGTETLVEWMGQFNDLRHPAIMKIDWIAYTRLSDRCQFEESVMCKLRGGD
ncbi:family 16 glycosylhydrolase [Pseudaestuariivita rosea]|uniref:family 16 glycosylhydrolase n=1 Tax=Pseudaestuariivita rosea TaxID=2763263 RepID=UPI001ABB57A0